jgi:transcriptional regulator with XRE-family HTH domain
MPAPPLPNYLKMLRKRSGLTQRELARLLGCRSGTKVSRYEMGRRKPTFETLLAYEIIFRVQLEQLFTGSHHRLRRRIHGRAVRMAKRLEARPPTPSIRSKRSFLINLTSLPPQ